MCPYQAESDTELSLSVGDYVVVRKVTFLAFLPYPLFIVLCLCFIGCAWTYCRKLIVKKLDPVLGAEAVKHLLILHLLISFPLTIHPLYLWVLVPFWEKNK